MDELSLTTEKDPRRFTVALKGLRAWQLQNLLVWLRLTESPEGKVRAVEKEQARRKGFWGA